MTKLTKRAAEVKPGDVVAVGWLVTDVSVSPTSGLVYLHQRFTWRPTGARTDRVNGRVERFEPDADVELSSSAAE